MSYNWLNIIQDCLLPPTCVLCGSSGFLRRDLCVYCDRQLPRNNPCCPRCAGSLPSADFTGIECGQCQRLKPAFDQTIAPFKYQDAVQLLITQLKFGADFKNARLLGQLLAEHISESSLKLPELILPVPLHAKRYRERGFNQAIEIARTVGKELKIPLDLTSCKRLRNTEQQSGLKAKQRRRNIKNAFKLVKPLPALHVAILDDVMTTGSTAHELAAVLKVGGVEKVDVWVCARA